MPFNSELGAAVEGTFTCHPAYSANDAGRPLRYAVDVFGLVALSGFIRRTGATSTVSSKFILCDDRLDLDAFPANAGFKDLLMRGSEGVFGMTIESAPITLASVTYPRGCITATPFGSVTLTQNQSWFSFDGVLYRI